MSIKNITEDRGNRILAGSDSAPISEAVGREKNEMEFVYPYLLYKELIALMVVLILLAIASIYLNAPLLDIANPGKTENPAKAPWYFIGLQEVLVYFDPWIAGVVLPLLILIGLIVIPYVDRNPKGSGEYTFSERKFAIINYVIGFTLWWVLIFIGWHLRGPNWQFYWIGESWVYQKPLEASLVNFSLLGGLALIMFYFSGGLILPRLLWKNFFTGWSKITYVITMVFILLMYGVPIKMFLRLFFHVRYILITPWFNI